MAITEFAMRHKRLCAVLLVICVVFFNIYALQQVAHAFVLIDDLLLLALAFAVTVAVAYGISFATQAAAERFAEDYVCDPTADSNSDGIRDIVYNAVTAGQVIYDAISADQADGGYFYDVPIDDDAWADFVDYVHANYSAGTNYVTEQTEQNIVTGQTFVYPNGSPAVFYWANEIGAEMKTMVTCYESSYNYNVEYATIILSSGYASYDNVTNKSVTGYDVNYSGNQVILRFYRDTSIVATRYIIANTIHSGIYSDLNQVDTGVYIDPDIYNDTVYDWKNAGTDERELAIDVYPAPAGVADPDITLADGTGLVVDQEKTFTDAIGATPADVIDRDIAGVPEAVTEAAIPADTAIDDSLTADEAMTADETQTSLKGLFISKFPFCIPWDLANAFKLIAAPAEAPHFEIDLFQDMDIDFQGSTEIDFDMADYPIIGQVCRWCFTVEFCIALMLATKKVMKW